ncbi:MAG: ChuX/HutX family heme-like substrate-binding protein, partial [Cetobacterium sp.]
EKVFLLVITPSFVLEIQDKFPSGFYAHGYLNFNDKNSSIGGHLSTEKIKEIFLVKDIMFGRESYSIKFYGEDEKEIFAVYVPRNEKKELIQECLDSFNKL